MDLLLLLSPLDIKNHLKKLFYNLHLLILWFQEEKRKTQQKTDSLPSWSSSSSSNDSSPPNHDLAGALTQEILKRNEVWTQKLTPTFYIYLISIYTAIVVQDLLTNEFIRIP